MTPVFEPESFFCVRDVIIRDASGKYIPYIYVSVIEKNAPFAPNENDVTDHSATVTKLGMVVRDETGNSPYTMITVQIL
jgi:hypothetical protein